MHRFFISPNQLYGARVRFADDQAHQMRRVLRLRPGDRVTALDGLGNEYDVVLEEVTNARVIGRADGKAEATGEPAARLTLYQSLLRREKFEWVLQKGTELGVSAFVPVITRRSLVRDAEDVTPEKLTRWQRIIREAAEQSGRGLLPELRPALTFGDAVQAARAAGRALIAYEGHAPHTIRDALQSAPRSVALFVGPEGGYEPEEVDEAVAAGAVAVTLGRRILRTETAAVVGAALILHELGEMG